LEDILRIIFEELDPVAEDMWRGGGDTRRDMIEIIYLLYLLKTRP
jgi:hypothetical protein